MNEEFAQQSGGGGGGVVLKKKSAEGRRESISYRGKYQVMEVRGSLVLYCEQNILPISVNQ